MQLAHLKVVREVHHPMPLMRRPSSPTTERGLDGDARARCGRGSSTAWARSVPRAVRRALRARLPETAVGRAGAPWVAERSMSCVGPQHASWGTREAFVSLQFSNTPGRGMSPVY